MAKKADGDVQADILTVMTEKNIQMRFNLFVCGPTIKFPNEEERIVGLGDSDRIALALYNAGLRGIPQRIADAAIGNIAKLKPFHPVRQYLNELDRNNVWDGKERVKTWLVEYLGAENNEFVRRIGELFLIAAVRRVRQPGCTFQEILTLVGDEGVGKSEVCKALVPNRDWFSRNLPLGAEDKLTMEKLSGVWICESAELVGNSRYNINEVKTFLSKERDGPARMAYAREPVSRDRQFVPIATTNETAFLLSMTGDRRFWPVKITKGLPDRVETDRDQLWAEANLLEKDGSPVRLEQRLWDAALDAQESFRAEDAWEHTLVRAVSPATVPQLLALLNIPIERATTDTGRRISAVMGKLKWKRERPRINGVRTTVYRKLTPFDPETFDHHSKYEEVDVPAVAEDEMDEYVSNVMEEDE